MAITAITEGSNPETINPIYNPCWFEFNAASPGTAAKAKKTITSPSFSNGDEVTFTFGNITYTWEKAATRSTELEFTSNQELVDIFNDNIEASNHHVAAINGSNIEFEAINYGAVYDFTLTSDSGSITTVSGVGQDYGDEYEDYSIYSQVYGLTSGFKIIGSNSATGGTYITELIRRFNDDNEYKFDVSGILRSQNFAHINNNSIPTLGGNAINFQAYIPSFYLISGQIYGDSVTTRQEDITSSVYGYFPTAFQRYNESSFDEYWDYPTHTTIKWLSSMPSVNRMYSGQSIILNFLGREGSSTPTEVEWRVKYEEYDKSGTSLTTSYTAVYDNSNDSGAGHYWVSFDPADFSSDVYKVEVTLQQDLLSAGWNDLSETKTFLLEDEAFVDTTFAFLNEFGVYELAHFTGLNSTSPSRNVNGFEVFQDDTVTAKDGTMAMQSVELQENRNYFSGWLREDELTWLKGLVKSPKAFKWENSAWKAQYVAGASYSKDVDDTLFQLNLRVIENMETTIQL